MVTFLGPLVHSCYGEGGKLQTNITGMCGECSVSHHTEFAPAHGMCAFPVYPAQALGYSAGNCLWWALGCMHFPGLGRSCSGSRILHKGADLVGPAFSALPRSEQPRWPGIWRAQLPVPRWRLHLNASPIPTPLFSWCTVGATSQVCRVSLLGS